MSTLAAIQSAFTTFIGDYTPDTAGGEPVWKRYTDPELFMARYPRSLEHGAYACGLGIVRDIGEQQRAFSRARADWTLRTSYRLSPSAGAGKVVEEATVYTWADRQIAYLLASGGAQGGLAAAGASLHLDSVEMSTPSDGWLWLVLRGSTSPFYMSY